jgi:hypothetical protein
MHVFMAAQPIRLISLFALFIINLKFALNKGKCSVSSGE